jgi:hypothetical protein
MKINEKSLKKLGLKLINIRKKPSKKVLPVLERTANSNASQQQVKSFQSLQNIPSSIIPPNINNLNTEIAREQLRYYENLNKNTPFVPNTNKLREQLEEKRVSFANASPLVRNQIPIMTQTSDDTPIINNDSNASFTPIINNDSNAFTPIINNDDYTFANIDDIPKQDTITTPPRLDVSTMSLDDIPLKSGDDDIRFDDIYTHLKSDGDDIPTKSGDESMKKRSRIRGIRLVNRPPLIIQDDDDEPPQKADEPEQKADEPPKTHSSFVGRIRNITDSRNVEDLNYIKQFLRVYRNQREMTTEELVQLYEKVFGVPPNTKNRSVLQQEIRKKVNSRLK